VQREQAKSYRKGKMWRWKKTWEKAHKKDEKSHASKDKASSKLTAVGRR
jgi:hypothetical protein